MIYKQFKYNETSCGGFLSRKKNKEAIWGENVMGFFLSHQKKKTKEIQETNENSCVPLNPSIRGDTFGMSIMIRFFPDFVVFQKIEKYQAQRINKKGSRYILTSLFDFFRLIVLKRGDERST